MISVLLSPIIPCYILANHIYYEAKLKRERRHLQTVTDDLGKGQFPVNSDEEQKTWLDNKRRRTLETRIRPYKLICSLETKSLNYRKLYSHFRY